MSFSTLLFLIQNCFVFLDGKFGAMMQVHIQNDGPVTLEIESPKTATSTSTTVNNESEN